MLYTTSGFSDTLSQLSSNTIENNLNDRFIINYSSNQATQCLISNKKNVSILLISAGVSNNRTKSLYALISAIRHFSDITNSTALCGRCREAPIIKQNLLCAIPSAWMSCQPTPRCVVTYTIFCRTVTNPLSRKWYYHNLNATQRMLPLCSVCNVLSCKKHSGIYRYKTISETRNCHCLRQFQ